MVGAFLDLQGIWFSWYGCYGKKPQYNKCHQKLVFFEQNSAKFKKIRAVKPRPKQKITKRYTLSNIKYFVKHNRPLKSIQDSIVYYFGDLDKFSKLLITFTK